MFSDALFPSLGGSAVGFPQVTNLVCVSTFYGLPRWRSGSESACQCQSLQRHGFDPWVGKIPWSRKRQPTPVLLPGQFHGQRGLAGYCPWCCKESYYVRLYWLAVAAIMVCNKSPQHSVAEDHNPLISQPWVLQDQWL